VGAAAGAGSAVTYRFTAVPDGENASTAAGDVFTVALTANGVTPVVIQTNVPMGKYIGTGKLKLLDVLNGDADTAVWVYPPKLNGFVP
jgi:hypothetical protein